MRHSVRPETTIALKSVQNGSLRKLAVELGFRPSFAATLSDVLHGKEGSVSVHTENRLRIALGLRPVSIVPVAPCPTCGSVHLVGDCHGKAGAAAIVADNEEVKQKRIYKMSKPAYRPRLPLALKERIEADGRTVEQLIEAALAKGTNE